MTPIYRSTATVLIEPGKPKFLSMEDMLGGAMQTKEHYQTQVEILKSREVALRTVNSMKLWTNPEFDPRKADASVTAKIKSMVGLSAAQTDWTEETLADSTVKPLMSNLSIGFVRLS